jgi:DNA polymerase zeta
MVSAILKRRIPYHDDLILTRWYSDDKGKLRWKVLKHRISQTVSTILLFDALDIIGRAGEAARLSGVELSQSFPGIRGSQYKVEGVLLRALKSLNSDEKGRRKGNQESQSPFIWSDKTQSQSPYRLLRGDNTAQNSSPEKIGHLGNRGYFFYSPSKADCSKQEALEAQALTLEPISGFYVDPIVVCDFTALYPSLIIAYNLCYSTCAGKLEYTSTRGEMKMKGCTTERLGPFMYEELQTAYVLKNHMKSLQHNVADSYEDRCYCVPSGSIFVGENVVKGVLPRVLDEILSTRAMLKKASKLYKKLMKKPPTAVLRQLEARQLALKYVANVTCKCRKIKFFFILLKLIPFDQFHILKMDIHLRHLVDALQCLY